MIPDVNGADHSTDDPRSAIREVSHMHIIIVVVIKNKERSKRHARIQLWSQLSVSVKRNYYVNILLHAVFDE